MSHIINLEYPILVLGGDGSTLWEGCGLQRGTFVAVNGETSTTAITAGMALSLDTATIVQPADRGATSAPLQQVVKVVGANTTGNLDIMCGVALNSTYGGGFVEVAGVGSVVPVNATANGTRRQNLVASATRGSVTPQDALATAPGTTLGHVVKIRGTTGGSTDSSSSAQVIAMLTCA